MWFDSGLRLSRRCSVAIMSTNLVTLVVVVVVIDRVDTVWVAMVVH
jgi:hypothetical protein